MRKLTAQELYDLFAHRKDCFAKQQHNGVYFPERRPITLDDIEKHMKGEHTLGFYCLDLDNTIRWACIDIDVKKKCGKCKSEGVYINDTDWKWVCPKCNWTSDAPELKKVKNEARLIYELFPEFSRILEFSGRRGYHIWIIFHVPVSASFGQKLIKARLNRINMLHHEVFPKQTELNEGRKYGNLVKIPQGIHKGSGQRSRIITMEGI